MLSVIFLLVYAKCNFVSVLNAFFSKLALFNLIDPIIKSIYLVLIGVDRSSLCNFLFSELQINSFCWVSTKARLEN